MKGKEEGVTVKTISKEDYKRIRSWVYRYARHLDIAFYRKE